MLEASSNRKKHDVTCKKWARSQMRYVTGGTATGLYRPWYRIQILLNVQRDSTQGFNPKKNQFDLGF